MEKEKEELSESVYPCGCWEQMLRMINKMDKSDWDPSRLEKWMKEFCNPNEISQDLKSLIRKMCAGWFDESNTDNQS